MCLSLVLAMVLVGCGSTPVREDGPVRTEKFSDPYPGIAWHDGVTEIEGGKTLIVIGCTLISEEWWESGWPGVEKRARDLFAAYPAMAEFDVPRNVWSFQGNTFVCIKMVAKAKAGGKCVPATPR